MRLGSRLFDELGFRGNIEDYFDTRNSFLNDVIDRRVGIPITLSVLYIEIARRIGLKLFGVGMPGHFIVKYVWEDWFIPGWGGTRWPWRTWKSI